MIDLKQKPSRSERKLFVVFTILGSILYFRFGQTTAALVAYALAVLNPVVYYGVPALRPVMHRGWMLLVFPIGWVVSHLVLVIVYYLAITPLGVLMRVFGHDPMKRRFDRQSVTYWSEHRTGVSVWRYFRQF